MEKLLASSGHKILINENCPCSKEHLDTTTKLIVAIYVCVIQTFVIRRVSLGGGLFDGRGLWGPTKSRV